VTRTKFLLLAGVLGVAALASSPASASAASCVHPYCPSYTLTVKKTGDGAGTVTSSPAGIECGAKCAASYEEGTVVTLTAKAAGGSTFNGWSGGGCHHGGKTCTVTVTADTTVTATFKSKGKSGGGEPAAIAHVARRKVPVRRGRAKLRLRCIGDTACHGTLKLTTKIKVRKGHKKKRRRIVIGRAPFHIEAGATTRIKVKLNKRGRRILKRRHRHWLKARATGPGLVSSKVKLKRVKKKHHR
jgi:hypothetical protein